MSDFFHEIINLHIEGKTIDEIASLVNKEKDEVIDDIVNFRFKNMQKFLDSVEEDMKQSIKADVIKNYILKLDKIKELDTKKRAIDIVKLADQGLTYEQIGNLHNVTRERVRQLLNKFTPDLIMLKKANKMKKCDKCKKIKLGVYNRGEKGNICNDCNKKIVKSNKKRWSKKYDKCLDCGTTKVPHCSRGRCKNCSYKYLYRVDPKRRKSIKKSGKKWRKKNPDKAKKINYKASQKLIKKRMELLYGDAHIRKLEEQDYKCKVCGISQEESVKLKNRKLCISHIGDTDDHSFNNLVALCSACHSKKIRGVLNIVDY